MGSEWGEDGLDEVTPFRVNTLEQLIRRGKRAQALAGAGEISQAALVRVVGSLIQAECRMRRAAAWN